MCLVLDANVFSPVFDTSSQAHPEYEPVLEWVTTGAGFLVYGGTKYKKELARAQKYLKLFLELRKQQRFIEVNGELVDQEEETVTELVNCQKCNDAHLIAIFRVSGCRVLCSNDRLADGYIKNKAYYRRGQRPPSIYRSADHKHLLCKSNIVRIRNVL